MSAKTPAQITSGNANDASVVHASDATVGNLSRSHTERAISRLQSAVHDYSASKTYAVNDLIFDNNIEYRCITAIVVPEPFDPAKWLPIGRGFPGDVEGPASSTQNQIAKFADATGKLITNSVVQIDPLGAFSSVLSLNSHSLPTGTGDLLSTDATQTLTNKTIDAANNTVSNIGASEIESGIITDQTLKATPVAADQILIADSADSDNLKRTTLTDLLSMTSQTPWTQNIDAATFSLLNLGGLEINNPADTFQYVFTPSAITADRNVTLPLLTGNDTFVFESQIQTLANKTLTTPTIASFVNAIHDHSDAANGGTIAATDLTGFDAAVAATPSVTANTAKVTNATHTGDVTGDQALTLESVAITGQTLKATAVAADEVLISDSADSGNLKRTTVAQFLAMTSQTPWTSNIDAATFSLLNLGGLELNNPADTFQYVFTPSAITADRTVTLPLLTTNDTFVFEAFSQTLTNKTIDADNNTISNLEIGAEVDGATVAGTTLKISGTGATGFIDFDEITTPANPATDDGRLYVRDDAGTTTLFFRDSAGTETNLLAGGGSQTPWLSDIDADGFNLIDVDNVRFETLSTTIPVGSIGIRGFVTGMVFNVPTGRSYNFLVNGTTSELLISEDEITLHANNNLIIQNDGTSADGYLQMEEIPNAQGDPTAPATTGIFYVKEVAGAARPFFVGDGTAAVDLASGGGSQTPWTSDIDADGFDLQDLSNVEFRDTTGAPAGTVPAIWNDATGMKFNEPTGDNFIFSINGTTEYTLDATAADFGSNNITNLGTLNTHTIPGGTDTFAMLAATQTLTNKTLGTGTVFSVIPTINDGITFTFNPNATVSGLNVGAHTADPSTPVNGDIYYNSTANELRSRINGAWVALGAGGGSQTPWLSDIDGDGFNLTDVGNIRFRAGFVSIPNSDIGVTGFISGMVFNVPTGRSYTYLANGISLAQLDATGLVMNNRIQGLKGTDVASADAITLGDGNFFDITGTTTINHMLTTDWQDGSVVTLQFDASLTVTHQAGGAIGDQADFFLAGAANFSATADDTLTLVFDGTNWKEVCRSVN